MDRWCQANPILQVCGGQLCSLMVFDPTAPQRHTVQGLIPVHVHPDYSGVLKLHKRRLKDIPLFKQVKRISEETQQGLLLARKAIIILNYIRTCQMTQNMSNKIKHKRSEKHNKVKLEAAEGSLNARYTNPSFFQHYALSWPQQNKHLEMESWLLSIRVFMWQFIRLLRFQQITLPRKSHWLQCLQHQLNLI